jgi:hypothetical protein
MRRLRQLEARRGALLAQCERQRVDLAARVDAVKDSPVGRVVGGVLLRLPRRAGSLARPLAWTAALASLLLLRRPRQLLMLLEVARTALSFGSRAALILRILAQLRGRRSERQTAKP